MEEAKWYVLHTFSGYENVAKDNLNNVIAKFNLQDRIFDIIIPMEEVIEEKNGKKKLTRRKIMPCYIIVKMIYGDDIWHNITRTRGVTGFVGPNGRPLALTEDEVRKLRLEKINVDIDLHVGDKIEVIDGALNNFTGVVTEVMPEEHKAKIVVEMFGQDTEATLSYSQIRKLTDVE